jgi:uncharacterized protein YjbI with pentapeptide repeats
VPSSIESTSHIAGLSGADLRGADLSWSNLKKSELGLLSGAGQYSRLPTGISHKWEAVWRIAQGTGFRPDLNGEDLSRAFLSETNLSYADVRGADLKDAILDRASFIGAELDQKTRIDPKWRYVWSLVNVNGESLLYMGNPDGSNGTLNWQKCCASPLATAMLTSDDDWSEPTWKMQT